MALPFLKPTEQPRHFAVFGKLPHRADFVHINIHHPVVRESDEALAAGLASLCAEPGWEECYDMAPSVSYAWRDRRGQQWTIGAWRASRDQAGRRFPLVAAVLRGAEEMVSNISLVPLAYEVFHDGLASQIDNALENSVEALACQQFLQSYAGEAGGIAADFDLARAVARRHAHETPAECLGETLGQATPAPLLEQACLNIAFYADFLRRFPADSSAQPIAVPMPAEAGRRALMACAWIELVACLAGGSARIAGVFMRGGELFVCLDSVSRPTVALLLGAAPRDTLLDLAREQEAWRSHRLYAETAYALSRLLADPQTRIASFFDFASHAAARLIASHP